MKKHIKELQAKTVVDLQKEIGTLRAEIAKFKVESKVKPQKDSNIIKKKEKQLAHILTVITQKELGISK